MNITISDDKSDMDSEDIIMTPWSPKSLFRHRGMYLIHHQLNVKSKDSGLSRMRRENPEPIYSSEHRIAWLCGDPSKETKSWWSTSWRWWGWEFGDQDEKNNNHHFNNPAPTLVSDFSHVVYKSTRGESLFTYNNILSMWVVISLFIHLWEISYKKVKGAL